MSCPCGGALSLVALLVQSPAMATQAAPAAPAQADAVSAYRVGPGDVLELTVGSQPELGRLATVQPTGTLRLPGKGELAVSGLTVDEIAARVAAALAGEQAAPAVVVRVREYHSQFVWVRGAVGRPGRKPLRGGTRLVDALLEAGGLAAGASGEVLIERPGGFDDGRREQRLRLRSTPGEHELEQLGMALLPGDVVTVGRQSWVVVSGAVRRPGRYPLGELATVRAVVEAAGGRLAGAAVVRRRTAEGPAHEIVVDLDAIAHGEAADPPLLPDDEVLVGRGR